LEEVLISVALEDACAEVVEVVLPQAIGGEGGEAEEAEHPRELGILVDQLLDLLDSLELRRSAVVTQSSFSRHLVVI
jgi:hypothetical protein